MSPKFVERQGSNALDEALLAQAHRSMASEGVDFRGLKPALGHPESFRVEYKDRMGVSHVEEAAFFLDYESGSMLINPKVGAAGLKAVIQDAVKAAAIVDKSVAEVMELLPMGGRLGSLDPRPKKLRLASSGELTHGASADMAVANARFDTVGRMMILPESMRIQREADVVNNCKHECIHAAQYNLLSAAEARRMDSLVDAGFGLDVLEGGAHYLSEPGTVGMVARVEGFFRDRLENPAGNSMQEFLDNRFLGFHACTLDDPRYLGIMMFKKIEDAYGAASAKEKAFDLLKETAARGPSEKISPRLYSEYENACRHLGEKPLALKEVRLLSSEARLLAGQSGVDSRMGVADESTAKSILKSAKDFLSLGGHPSEDDFRYVRIERTVNSARIVYVGQMDGKPRENPWVPI